MLVKEYLELKGSKNNFTFIIQKAVKDDNSPFYHEEYKTTPIQNYYEWKHAEKFLHKYIVVKADHAPIDPTGVWLNWYQQGDLNCCMITTEQDLITRYGDKQGQEMINYYDKEARKQLK